MDGKILQIWFFWVILALFSGCVFLDDNGISMKNGRWEGDGVKFNVYRNRITPDGSTLAYGYCMTINLVITNTNGFYTNTFCYGGDGQVITVVDNHFLADVYGCIVEGFIDSPSNMHGTARYVTSQAFYGHEEGATNWTAVFVEAR